MATEKTPLSQAALDLLERINQELKNNKMLDIINTRMVGVVKDLNEVRIYEITGKDMTDTK